MGLRNKQDCECLLYVSWSGIWGIATRNMILVSGDAKLLGGPKLHLLTGAPSREPANPDRGEMTQQMRSWTSPKSINPNPGGLAAWRRLPMLNIKQGYKIDSGRAGTADSIRWEA